MLVAGLFYCHLRYFYTVLILIDSRYVIAGTVDDTVQVWDMELKKMVSKPFQGYKNLHLFTCSFLCNDTHATLCSGNKSVQICDVKTGKTIVGPSCRHPQHFRHMVNSVSFSHHNKYILCSSNGMIQIWDSKVGKSVQDLFQGWHLMCHFVE